MALRSTLLTGVLAATALGSAPALARDQSARDAADRLSDARLQASVASTMAALSAALLDIRIAPFARVLDSVRDPEDARSIPPDATLGDLAGRDAQRLPYEISRQVPQAMGAMADMAGAVDDLMPQLEAIGRRVERALPRH